MAAAVLHQLIALMDRRNGVVVSQATLAKIVGCHRTSLKRALKYLSEYGWVQIVKIGKAGTVNGYIVNDRVGWADYRDNLRLSRFSAVIVADEAEQDELTLSSEILQKVPIIHPPEEALPSGEWPRGETGYLDGLEPVIEAQADQTEENSNEN